MPYTIQLDIDAATESKLATLAARLEQEGAETTVRRLGSFHHLSLGVYDDLPAATTARGLHDFVSATRPFGVRLASVGVFPGGVIFLGVVADATLLDVHRRFHAAFAAHRHACRDHFRVGAWVPHVTLALDVVHASVGRLVEAVCAHWVPMEATCEAIRLVRFHPVETVWRQAP